MLLLIVNFLKCVVTEVLFSVVDFKTLDISQGSVATIHLRCGGIFYWQTCQRAIYLTCVNFFFFIFFKSTQIISRSTRPIFTIFSPNERYFCDFFRFGPPFRLLKGCCHGN